VRVPVLSRASFDSERAVCDLLRVVARDLSWTAYPEQGGWDVLLVLPDGTQVGVQAKLRANLEVLAQCVVRPRSPAPDVRAVLVPVDVSDAFHVVARELDVALLDAERLDGGPWSDDAGARAVRMGLTVGPGYLAEAVSEAPRRVPTSGRVWTPPFVPDVPAGVPSPRTVSPWRVSAARFCAELRAGLEVTRRDIAARGMNPSTWMRWLDRVPGSSPARYVARRPHAWRGVHDDSLPDRKFPQVAVGFGLPDPCAPAR